MSKPTESMEWVEPYCETVGKMTRVILLAECENEWVGAVRSTFALFGLLVFLKLLT